MTNRMIDAILGIALAGAMFGVGYATAVVNIRSDYLEAQMEASKIEVDKLRAERGL